MWQTTRSTNHFLSYLKATTDTIFHNEIARYHGYWPESYKPAQYLSPIWILIAAKIWRLVEHTIEEYCELKNK